MDQLLHISQQWVGTVQLVDRGLNLDEALDTDHRLEAMHHLAWIRAGEQGSLGLVIGVTQRNFHHETVELGLR